MIQVNLLPDVKAVYVKAQRTKRTVITLSLIISSVAIGIVAILASVAYGAQKLSLDDVQGQIDSLEQQIKDVEDLDKILTVQNQLITLNPLHDAKPVATRVFGYISQTTPAEVRIETIRWNFEENSVEVSGSAPSYEIINKYVDTLKFTELQAGTEAVDPGEELPKAFSDVVLEDFSKDQNETTYVISFAFDAVLYDSQSENVKIIVPEITTTRSQLEAPSDLFKLNESTRQEGETQ